MEITIIIIFMIIGALAHWAIALYNVWLTVDRHGLNIFNLALLILLTVGPVYFIQLFASI